jgi:hypothetical protein
MKTPRLVILAISAMLSIEQSAPTIRPDPPMACDDCDEWNRQRDPFKLFGNTYYVGTAGLSSLLIAVVEQAWCGTLVAEHPTATGLAAGLTRMKSDPSSNPFIDPGACRAYAADARKRLGQRLAEEKKGA